ncbi:hypothetical protein [Arhodomonas sp. SL1]|uniref:hypothetical protein n=1 Tax=Arhodomonas sp. SL1 TaxID=3425691 RepID=UPI003F880F16
MAKKFAERVSFASLMDGTTDPHGREFLMPDRPVDLSGVRILHVGVDTIRQLYHGRVKVESIGRIHAGARFESSDIVQWADREWLVAGGGRSGYRYRLQNNELGLIVLLGSRYKNLRDAGSHLKIECSPHFLKDQGPEQVQRLLDELAATLLEEPTPHSCAVHLAVDVQGWKPPKDLEERLKTKARRKVEHTGIDRLELVGGETCQRYGGGQSYLFGGANSVQFALYRKDLEAYARDKLDYWEGVWAEAPERGLDDRGHDPDKAVWRLEWRFHHSVVQQIQTEQGQGFESYQAIAPYLTSLYQYGLNLFRLDYSCSYIDPFWQLLTEDITIAAEQEMLTVCRVYKTPGRGNEKNLALALGNMLSLYARKGYKAHRVIAHLRRAGFWQDLCAYWRQRDLDPQQVIEHGLAVRRLAT